MKKEDKNIIIDKDNYKGYVELYRVKCFPSNEEDTYLKRWIKKFAIIFLCAIPITFTVPLQTFIPIMEIITNIGLFIWMTIELSVAGIGIKNLSSLRKEKYQAVKNKYPYVDISVSEYTLKKSLEDVGIIQKKYEDHFCIMQLKVEEYEKYLKAEEIKENYFEETKYDSYVVNPPIEQEELEKVKVKLLTR